MRHTFNPIRLLAEILVIAAGAQAAVLLVLPVLAPAATLQTHLLLGVALLVLLITPITYWRSMVAAGRAPGVAVRRSQTNRSLGWAIALTAAAQLLGLALTAAFVVWQRNGIEAAAWFKFDRGAGRIEAEVKRRFEHPVDGLMGARGAIAAAGAVDRSGFRAYVESRDLPREFPGVRGFAFIERVLRSDLARFVAAERADQAPDFAVRSSGAAPDLYLIKYIEPMANNRGALGFDLGQETVRREAVERAVSTGKPTLTGRINLTRDGVQKAGIAYLMPVYRQGAALDTLERRQDALVGLLSAPMVLSELMDGVTDAANGLLEFELFDGSTAGAGELLFNAVPRGSRTQQAIGNDSLEALRFESSRDIVVGGRTLMLRVGTTPAFDAAMDSSSLAIVGLGGTLASTLLALTVWLLAVGRVRAQRLAVRMTADLDRLAKVVQLTSSAVVLTDPQLRITWVNEAFTKISGYTLAESQGRTPGELLANPDADPVAVQALLKAVAAGEACRVEVLNRAKDGSEYWIDTEIQPTQDAHGVLTGFMEIGADITARKEAEQARLAAEGELRTMLDVFPGHVIQVSEDFHYEYANQRYAILFGLRPEQLLGRHLRDVLGEAGYEAARKRREQIVASGQPISFERHFEPPSGGTGLDLLVTHFMVESAGPGGPRKFYQFAIDISERKGAERALAARDKELSAARDEAERANAAKSGFLSGVSHELRTPLNAILGFGQLLELEVREAEQVDYVQEIMRAGRHLLELINEVLDLARVESGRFTISLESVPVLPMIDECLTLIRPLAEARGLRVVCADQDCSGHVLADRTRLKQVLLNLLSNAVKFNRANGTISIACMAEDDSVQIRVSDTGTGLTPEQQRSLFVAFERLDADRRGVEGTGIGLALSKSLTDLMGGQIGVESTPGQGSTFWVRMPVAEAHPGAAPEAKASVAQASGDGRRQWDVLCIEDNPANLRLMERILAQRTDIRLLSASAPGLGLELAAAHRPALILLDINLPDMNGYDVMKCLRENAATRDIPVVAVSANAMPKDVARGKAAGFIDYLTKPLDVGRFNSVVDRVLKAAASAARPTPKDMSE